MLNGSSAAFAQFSFSHWYERSVVQLTSNKFVNKWCYFSRLMASDVPNIWKGHIGISVSKLCFKNALGLLINNRSNFREEWIIVQKIAATFWEERIIPQKFGVNHQAKQIVIWKIAWIKTVGVMKIWGNFVETLFQAKFRREAMKSQEFRWNLFSLLLHNTARTFMQLGWKVICWWCVLVENT